MGSSHLSESVRGSGVPEPAAQPCTEPFQQSPRGAWGCSSLTLGVLLTDPRAPEINSHDNERDGLFHDSSLLHSSLLFGQQCCSLYKYNINLWWLILKYYQIFYSVLLFWKALGRALYECIIQSRVDYGMISFLQSVMLRSVIWTTLEINFY